MLKDACTDGDINIVLLKTPSAKKANSDPPHHTEAAVRYLDLLNELGVGPKLVRILCPLRKREGYLQVRGNPDQNRVLCRHYGRFHKPLFDTVNSRNA